MANDGSVIIDVAFNTDKARKQYQDFGNEAAQQLDAKIGKSRAFNQLSDQSVEFAKKASLSIAAVGTAVAGFSIKSAADMQAMNAQFSQVFGDLEGNAQSSIDSIAKETNILPNRLKPAFTSMAAFAKTTGMDTSDALDLTSRATKAAADSAAFYDKSIGEVSESLQQYLKGNYENDAALGISSTETTRNAAANKLYGKSFNDLSESQKQLTLLQMVEDGNKLSGALGQAAREGGGLENVMGNMKQAITDLGAAFGAPLLQPFLNIVQKISGAMAKLATVFRENPSLVYVVVGAVTTLAAALGAAYLAANNFAKLKAIMSGVKAGFLALTSPVALIVLAIGALVTAFIYFYKTSETFRSKVNGMVAGLKQFMVPLGDIVKGIKLLVQAFKEMVTNGPGPEIAKLREQFLKLLPESVWNGMIKLSQSINSLKIAFSAIKGIVSGSINSLSDLDGFLEGAFGKTGTKNIQAIGNAVKGLINWFKNLLNPVQSASKSFDIVNIAFVVLKSVILTLLGPIGLAIKAFELFAKAIGGGDTAKGIEKIISGFDSLATGIQKNGSKIGESAGKAIEGILTAIASALPGIISGGLQIIAGLVSGIAQGLPSLALAASQLILAFTGAMLLLIPQVVLSATTIIVAFLGSLTMALPQIIIAGTALLVSLIAGFTSQIPTIVVAVATMITTFLDAVNEQLPSLITSGMNLLLTFLQGIADNIGQVTQTVITIILNFVNTIAANMGQIIDSAVNLMINFLNGLASRMGDIITAGVNLVVSFINGIANNIGRVIDAAVSLIVAILNGIANNIGRIINAGMNIVDALVNGVISAQGRLMDAAIRLINGFASNIRGRQSDVRSAAFNLLDAIVGVFVPDALFSAGKNIINGLVSGIGSMVGSAASAAAKAASAVVSAAKSALGIHSPSRVFRDLIGKNMMLGWELGISNNAKYPQKSMSNAVDNLINDIPTQIPAISALISGQLSPERSLAIDTTSRVTNRNDRYNNLDNNKSETTTTKLDQLVVIMSQFSKDLKNLKLEANGKNLAEVVENERNFRASMIAKARG